MSKKKAGKRTKSECDKQNSMLERVSSGIPGLDSLIEGGFVKKSINLVAGGPGSGKSIFAMQFLVDGIKKGEAGIYITFEEKKEKFYEDMNEFGWNIEKFEKEGKFLFLEYTPEQVKKILTEGGGIVENIIEKMKVQRIVIDSISSFGLLYEDDLTKKEASLALFELINKWGCTGIMTSQDESKEGNVISAAMEFEVDGIILLYHFKRKGVRDRGLEILKMRGTKISEKTVEFRIGGKGIEVTAKIVDV